MGQCTRMREACGCSMLMPSMVEIDDVRGYVASKRRMQPLGDARGEIG